MKIYPCLFAVVLSTILAIDAFSQPLPDRSAELQARIDSSEGNLVLQAGTYALDRGLEFDLSALGGVVVKGEGAVTLVMRGPGPALRFTGTHEGTANPSTFKPETWRQRMPLIADLEILGEHEEADGIELIGTVQAIVDRVAVRHARHGIRLHDRNRNVIISNCHLYENSGVGLYLDDVNLHQINVANSHISYNRQGGVVVRDGQVRNLHITGCDIEGNMPGDETATRAANVWIDLSAHDPDSSVAEVAITGCTVQHSANRGRKAAIAPGGANIRIEGRPEYPVDTVTIGNNVLSDTSISVDIDLAKDITLTGNAFFTSMPGDLRVERSQRIIVSGNSFNPRQDWSIGGIVFRESKDCIFNANTVRGSQNPVAAILLERCEGIRISDCILSENDHGILMRDSTDCEVADSRIEAPRKGGPSIRRVTSLSLSNAAERSVTTHAYKQVGDLEIKLDCIRYVGDEAIRPAIVWIHGGALINGRRQSTPARLVAPLLEAGFALISIDYRLAPETKLPEIIEDLEDAFAWINKEGRERLGIDPSRIGVMGGSAGGYLTLVSGYRAKPRPKALVSFWGYGDLIGPWYSQPSPHPRHHRVKITEDAARQIVAGPPIANAEDREGNGGHFYQFCRQRGIWPSEVSDWDPHTQPEKFTPYMPLLNVDADYPSALLIHGTNDTDVPYEQSVMMAERFRELGIDHELISVADAEHGLSGGDPDEIETAYRQAIRFAIKHVRDAGE